MQTKLLFALIGVSLLASAKVGAATIFVPTDGDVNFLFGDLMGGTLAMFDDSDQSYSGPSLTIDVPGITGIAGPFTGGDHIASNTNGSLTLTGSDNFILGLFDTGSGNWLTDTLVTSVGANSYTVSFGNGANVVQIDVQVVPAVPLPAAAWLFGSGLLGLAGGATIRRKRLA